MQNHLNTIILSCRGISYIRVGTNIDIDMYTHTYVHEKRVNNVLLG